MIHDPETTRPPPVRSRAAGGAVRFRRHLLSVLGVTAVVTVASASTAFAAGATVTAATSSNFGTVLANAQGFALYTLPTDKNGMSSCTGPCVPVWPAVTVPAGTTPTAGAGVTGTVAAALQSNGTYQVTYNGSPLYTFVGDTTPGEVSGNNVGGFTVVKLAAPPTSTTPPPSAPPPAATTTPTTATPSSTPTTAASGGSRSTSTPAPVVAPVVARHRLGDLRFGCRFHRRAKRVRHSDARRPGPVRACCCS